MVSPGDHAGPGPVSNNFFEHPVQHQAESERTQATNTQHKLANVMSCDIDLLAQVLLSSISVGGLLPLRAHFECQEDASRSWILTGSQAENTTGG